MKKIAAALLFILPASVQAVGINTDNAIPVAKKHLVMRTQARYSFADSDPSGAGRYRHQIQFPTVLVYGATPQTALFGVFPVVYRDLSGNETKGIGDITLKARHEIAKKDWILKTWRLALIGGIEIPSGDAPFSSHSVDFPLGLVTSLQTDRFEFDFDARYKFNTEGNGTDHGDEVFYNLAYQHRLWPVRLPETGIPHQFNAVVELNGQFAQDDKTVGGADVANTGGSTLFLSPGLQYVMKRMIAEISFQYPIVQELNGTQLKTTFALNGGARIQF